MKPFENFDPDYNNQHDQLELIKGFRDSDKKRLIIAGQVGTGKTHLAKEYKKLYGKMSHSDMYTMGRVNQCEFIPVEDFYSLMFEYLFSYMEYEGNLKLYFKDLFRKPCVIIDDLGSELNDPKGNFISGFQNFLDKFTGKLVITTNYTEDKLRERYGDKIFSRLCEGMEWVSMTGKDHRRVG